MTMDLTWVIVIVLIVIICYWQIKKMSYWMNRGVPQRHPIYAVYFNLFGFFIPESLEDFFNHFYNSFPNARYFGYYLFGKPSLFIRDDEIVKLVTVKDADHFTDRSTFIPEDIDPLWGKNLFALQGQRWREMRIMLSPSFTSSKIKQMFVLMEVCAQKFAQHFSDKGDKLTKIHFQKVCSRFCVDIIASIAFGVEVDSLKNPNNEFYMYGMKISDFRSFWKSFKFMGYLVSPTLYRLFGLKFIEDDCASFFTNIIDEAVKLRKDKGFVRHDLLNLLLNAQKESEIKGNDDTKDAGFAAVKESLVGKISKPKVITNEDITAQAIVFFIGGFDSVSSAMSFMAHELAENLDIQERLREEILETHENYGGELKYDTVASMKYMDMVVSETLRKWPVNAGLDRICSKPYTLEPAIPGGRPVQLEVGDLLTIPSLSFQRSPKYFPNPNKFDPERFNDVNRKNINPYAYTPFGSGIRNCIGSRFALLQMKVFFFHLLKNFELVPIEETDIPIKMKRTKMGLLPHDDFQLGLKRINN